MRLAGRRRRGAGRSGARRRRRWAKPIGAKLGLHGPGLLGESASATSTSTSALSAPTASALLDAAVAAYRAHPQVEAVFTAGRDRRALRCRPARPTSWTPDRARPRELIRSRALGRLLRGAEAATSRRSPTPARHRRDPRQPVGLRPARADPVLAAAACTRRDASSEPVETVDIMPTLAAHDRRFRSRPARSTAIASTDVPERLVRRAKHLKTRDFSFIRPFRHEGADRSVGRGACARRWRVVMRKRDLGARAGASVALERLRPDAAISPTSSSRRPRATTSCWCFGPTSPSDR